MYIIKQLYGRYVIINETTREIQSAWDSLTDAIETMRSLNKNRVVLPQELGSI